jgi:hypothetical protein
MAVEFLILSGTRQGERLELEGNEFRIGDGSGCDIRFDSGQDPGAKHRTALIRREDDGWRIRSEGAGLVWLNQTPLQAPSPIRSSDVIRLSESGPDLAFTIVTRRPAGPVVASREGSRHAPRDEPADIPTLPTLPAQRWPKTRSRPSNFTLPIAAFAIVCAALVIVFTISVLRSRDSQDPKAASGKGGTAATDQSPRRDPGKLANGGRQSSEPTKGNSAAPASGPDKVKGSTDEPPRAVTRDEADNRLPAVDANRRAVFTLAVESPGGILWAFGTCFAIRRDTLVTTATLACEFEKLRTAEAGWKLWALGAEQNARIEVKELRIHAGYAEAISAGKPPHFHDIALLTVGDELPAVCPIGTKSELDQAQRQTRVACLGVAQPIPQEGERPDPIGRFDTLSPDTVVGRLIDVSPSPGGPDASRLLFLPNSFPPTLWGSPILNEAGHAIGVFSMVEQEGRDSSIAILVAPTLHSVASWLQQPASGRWVPPVATRKPASSGNRE